jgi:hypothetical protein
VIQDSSPLPVAVHRAVQSALPGAKSDADAAARLLMAIPTTTSAAVLLEVEIVLMRADPRFWIALEAARDWFSWDELRTSPYQLATTDTVPAVSVKSFFADGRVRERAVRLLAESGSLAALPVLGLRAADWVPQVREVAREAIIDRLADDTDGAALVAIAPMALLLAERREGSWLAEQVTRRLADASSRHVVGHLVGSPDLRLRRAAYHVLIIAGTLELGRAVQAAVRDPDIVIRIGCAEFAKQLATDANSIPVIRRMLASHTPAVRAETLLALNRIGDLDTITAALPDRSSLVRGTARFCLRARGIDVAELYRRLFSGDAGAVTPGAVAGLVEAGTAADTSLITPLLYHPRVKVRVEAIRGLQRLAPSVDVDQMLALISEDPSPAVTRQATAAIVTRGASIDPDRLLALLEPAHAVPIRLAAREILASRGTAWRLAVDVMLLADPDDTVAGRAKLDLESAMQQQLYTKPSGRAAELLTTHIVDADRLLAPATARLLRFILGLPRSAEPAVAADSRHGAGHVGRALSGGDMEARGTRARRG